MKFMKLYVAESAHLLHPDHKPKVLFAAVDEDDGGEVPEPPKPTVVDEKASEIEELKKRLAALESGK